MAQAGLARAVHPAFTSNDGDVVIVLANDSQEASVDAIGIIAAEVVADAIRDAVGQATSLGGVPDMHTPGARNPDDPAWSMAWQMRLRCHGVARVPAGRRGRRSGTIWRVSGVERTDPVVPKHGEEEDRD